jgi:hypothetical protein
MRAYLLSNNLPSVCSSTITAFADEKGTETRWCRAEARGFAHQASPSWPAGRSGENRGPSGHAGRRRAARQTEVVLEGGGVGIRAWCRASDWPINRVVARP